MNQTGPQQNVTLKFNITFIQQNHFKKFCLNFAFSHVIDESKTNEDKCKYKRSNVSSEKKLLCKVEDFNWINIGNSAAQFEQIKYFLE